MVLFDLDIFLKLDFGIDLENIMDNIRSAKVLDVYLY